MVRELNCHRRHQLQVDGCYRQRREMTIAFISRRLVGGGRISAVAALVPNAGSLSSLSSLLSKKYDPNACGIFVQSCKVEITFLVLTVISTTNFLISQLH